MGCSSTKTVIEVEDSDIRYSLVSMIHADANYLYHEDGESKKANEEALKESIATAKKAKHGEVFIFHQKPERKAFLFFPKKDRVFYHYKKGVLIEKGNYSPIDGGLSAEAQIYQTRSLKKDRKEYFMYFGHEIPTFKDRNYHRSMPDMNFDTDLFSNDLKKFSSSFDVTILSTCNNGNPHMIDKLQSVSDVVIASPQNLHLSYMSMEKFDLLEKNESIPNLIFADFFAKHAFKKLSSTVSTMVTITTYWIEKFDEKLPALSKGYEDHLRKTSAKPRFTDNIDCAKIPLLSSSINSNGIILYYKPPAFGRKANLESHSGWGCKE